MDENGTKRAVISEAADWVVRLHGADHSPEDRKRFVRWLKRSPMHVQEFLQTEADWLALEGVDAPRAIDVDVLLGSSGGNVVPLKRRNVVPESGRKQRLRVPAALAAAVLLAAVLVVLRPMTPETYATTLGEQRTIVLADGSIVELNTQSRIRVRMTDRYRDIELVAGEVLFSVAADRDRPFRVHSGPVQVQAVGTQFNVYRRPAETVVTVLEGNVEVRNGRAGDNGAAPTAGKSDVAQAVELFAGDRAVADAATIVRTEVDEPRHAVAWRERRLVFDNEPLSGVAAEFNRYNSQRIVIEGELLAARKISGVFDADHPEAIVQFLARNDEAEVIEQPGRRWILRSRP